MKKYSIKDLNKEIFGKKILPDDLKKLTITVLVTDAGITLHFEPNINEIKAHICFLYEEEDCINKAMNMVKDIKKKIKKLNIPVEIAGDEGIAEYIIEQEENIHLSKMILKEIKKIKEE